MKFVTESHHFLSSAIEGSMWRRASLPRVNIDVQYYGRIVACLSGKKDVIEQSADGRPMFIRFR